jgi:hypothetical protein
MQLNSFMEGLSLLFPYYDDPESYSLGAEHDEIYIYATDRPLPDIRVKRLCELGFFQPEVNVDDFKPEDYKPEEGWCAYV